MSYPDDNPVDGGGGGGVDPKDIYGFLDRYQHSRGLAPTDNRVYRPPAAVHEYPTAARYDSSQYSSEYSLATTTTAPSSRRTAVFDESSVASRTSDLTLERQEVLPPDVVENIVLQAQADNLDTLYLLPCEFFHLTQCNMVFRYDEVDAWIEHILHHHLFRNDLPVMMLCWYCDGTTFEATDGRDRRRNFQYRMYHIKDHILREGKTVYDIRADYYFLEYLHQHDLIDSDTYENVRSYHEAPQIEGMHELGWRPSSMLWREERQSAVMHDLARQERRHRRRHHHERR